NPPELRSHGQFIGLPRIGRSTWLTLLRLEPVVNIQPRLAIVHHDQFIAPIGIDVRGVEPRGLSVLPQYAKPLPAAESCRRLGLGNAYEGESHHHGSHDAR